MVRAEFNRAIMIPRVLRDRKKARKKVIARAWAICRLHLHQGDRSALLAAQHVIDGEARKLDPNAAQYAARFEQMPYRRAEERQALKLKRKPKVPSGKRIARKSVPIREFLRGLGEDLESRDLADRWDRLGKLWVQGKYSRIIRATKYDRGAVKVRVGDEIRWYSSVEVVVS